MDLYDTVFSLIDMRSFSNLWYWIALAAIWSMASYFVLGVPYDIVLRARRHGQGTDAQRDFEDITRVNVNRLLHITGRSGYLLVAFGFAVLTLLAMTGFWYGVEFAQAVFLIALPMSMVFLLSVGVARRIRREQLAGEELWRQFRRLRFGIQALGMFWIFVTAIYGMYQNLVIGVL